MSKKDDNVLIMFVKAPRIGAVKTRLQPELTPEQSLALYQAMVEDMVRQLDDVGFCDLKIFFYPADAHKEIREWLGDALEYFPQHGNDLGEKMHHAIAELLHLKYQKVVLVGSDIPTLDSTTVVRAFTSLDDYDLVLGPCNDGGYYLIGMKYPHAAIFEDIAWSTSLVLQQTIQKARTAKLEIVQLEKKSDIDAFAEVKQLWKFLKKQHRKGSYVFNLNTYQILKTFFESGYAADGGQNERILQ